MEEEVMVEDLVDDLVVVIMMIKRKRMRLEVAFNHRGNNSNHFHDKNNRD